MHNFFSIIILHESYSKGNKCTFLFSTKHIVNCKIPNKYHCEICSMSVPKIYHSKPPLSCVSWEFASDFQVLKCYENLHCGDDSWIISRLQQQHTGHCLNLPACILIKVASWVLFHRHILQSTRYQKSLIQDCSGSLTVFWADTPCCSAVFNYSSLCM